MMGTGNVSSIWNDGPPRQNWGAGRQGGKSRIFRIIVTFDEIRFRRMPKEGPRKNQPQMLLQKFQ